MYELAKAYEKADMLKALDLPISKDQLEDIERLEKESGKEQREDLRLYFYEKCFAHYTKRILNIRQAKIRGEVIVAKPVLLLAIIDGIGMDLFMNNEFHLTDWLEKRYIMLMQQYMKGSQFQSLLAPTIRWVLALKIRRRTTGRCYSIKTLVKGGIRLCLF